MKRDLRIFISSPGDVYQERITAKKVIDELNKTFYRHINIEAILWEDMPLLASATFQEGIDAIIKQYNIDVAVFILWSRLGTTLGKSYLKKDGSPYLSGTEYEFDLMMEAFKKNGRPRVLAYVKNDPLKNRLVNESDENLQEIITQHHALKSFIKENFYDEESGGNYAYTSFGGNVSFESRLKSHLTSIVLGILGNNVNIIKWHRNPYVGLRSFECNENEIFFGREKAVDDIMSNVLSNLGEGKSPSIVLLGESGSGKSSLVQAGIVPMVDYIDERKYSLLKIVPSLLGEKVYDNFIYLFLSAYPILEETPIAAELRKGISEDYNFAHLQYAVRRSGFKNHPILFFDQFEELFNDANIKDDQRILFLRLLKGLVVTKEFFVIISMRNDFYSCFHKYLDFNSIKQNATLVYDIPLLGSIEYSSIIKEPAKLAGIEWEINEMGHSLDEAIINDAIELKSLPLIQFTLLELYKIKGKNNLITYNDYRAIGGIKGSFLSYTTDVYNSLSKEEVSAFNDILSKIVTISNVDTETFVRKTSLIKDAEISDIHKSLIKKLVDAHILVSNKNTNGESTITLVHEMLINSWPVIGEWIKSEKYFIKESSYYEKRALQWSEATSKGEGIIKDDELLLKVEYFDFWWASKSTNTVKKYINASLDYKRKLGITRWGIYILAYSFLIYMSVIDIDFSTNTINKLISISASFILFVPLFLNLALHITRRPTYETAKPQFVTWLFFLIVSIILDVLDRHLNPQDYLITDGMWINYLVYIICVCATINAYQQYRLRLKWRERKFKVPFMVKIFNKEKYKIAATFMNSLFTVIFILAMIFGWNGITLSDKLTMITDYFTRVLEEYEDELSNSFFYTINEVKEVYLQDVFPDSVNVISAPNHRKRELARTFYNRSMPDSALLYLNTDSSMHANILRSKIFLCQGMYKEAASNLIYSPDELYANLPSQGMTWIDPISVYILGKEYNKAKDYITYLEDNLSGFSEHMIDEYCNALYSIVDDFDENDHMFYNYIETSLKDSLQLIPISKLVMADVLDINEKKQYILQSGLNLLIEECHMLPSAFYGEWMAQIQVSDYQTWIFNLTFKESYSICKVLEIGTNDQTTIDNLNEDNMYYDVLYNFVQPYTYDNLNDRLISTSADLFDGTANSTIIDFYNISNDSFNAGIYDIELSLIVEDKLGIAIEDIELEFMRVNHLVEGGSYYTLD